MSKFSNLSETEYYTVNDRPVKIVPTSDGGKQVLVLNLHTGKFESDMSYLSRCYNPEQDVEQFSQIVFEQYIIDIRRTIEEKIRENLI